MFVVCVEAIKYLILYYLHYCTFDRNISKRHVKIIRTVLDQGRGLLLPEIQFMVNSEEDSRSLNRD